MNKFLIVHNFMIVFYNEMISSLCAYLYSIVFSLLRICIYSMNQVNLKNKADLLNNLMLLRVWQEVVLNKTSRDCRFCRLPDSHCYSALI